MDAVKNSRQSRRGFLAASAAVGVSNLLSPRKPPKTTTLSGLSTSTFRKQQLVDLRRRIAATRWPDKETVTDQSQGVQLAKMQELVRYWGTDYDWRKAEAKLNALPQFVTNDRRRGHSLHPRPLPSPECACR